MAQTLSENNLQILHPNFPQGEARVEFEDLVDDLDGVATLISDEVHVDNVINNVFTDEYISCRDSGN
jgi:hypothetical protein